METAGKNITHTWVWILALFIFAFNSFLLPEGLTFTLLLSPVWFYIAYKQKMLSINVVITFVLGAYAIIHIYNGVEILDYIVSLLMMEGLVLFLLASYKYINNPLVYWDKIFRDIAVFNFILVLCSLPLLYLPGLKQLVWYLVPISENISNIPRLKLFTLEASHYSFLLAPVAIYFYSRILFFNTGNILFTLALVTIPLILSFSLGVIICLFISGLAILCIYFKRIFSSAKHRHFLLISLGIFTTLLICAYFYFPANPLFMRLENILHGRDTSARGRTYEAFILAQKIVEQKSEWFGIGLGQLKILGRNIIIQYYSYTNMPIAVRIPNAAAETIIYFGYIGFAIRIGLQLFLFIKTKVYRHPFRLWLFLFVFIYQFTGSYITNFAEYLIWMLAFSSLFPEFVKAKNPSTPVLA
ncbi:MAG: hypothetical protein ACXWDO_07315 [Bacteroidia bacterium]